MHGHCKALNRSEELQLALKQLVGDTYNEVFSVVVYKQKSIKTIAYIGVEGGFYGVCLEA
jgi:hypothetical protein